MPGAARPAAGSSVRDRRLAEAGVLLAVLVWSANFVVVKAAIGELGPLTFSAIRFVVATLTLFLLVRLRTGTIRRPTGLTVPLVAMGMLGFGGYQVVWTLGLTQITAGSSALLVAASPVLTALLAGAVGMDRLTPPKLMTLEQAIAYIDDDEMVEVTPKSIRLRKALLDPNERKKAGRKKEAA